MEIKGLLKSQANDIFLAITEAGWNPTNFTWTSVTSSYSRSSQVSQLNLNGSSFHFKFENISSEFNCSFSPGKQFITEHKRTSSFTSQLTVFKDWVKYLSREVKSPNLWAEIANNSALLETNLDGDSNKKFTKTEKKVIADGIEEIKQYLLTTQKLDLTLIESPLKYLVESSDRLGRKDWKNILIGTIISIIIQGGVAGYAAQEILHFVWTVLSAILVHKLYLPEMPI